MSEAAEISPPPPPSNIRESIVQEAIERVRSRGDSTRRFAVMELPTPLLNDLCEKLLSQKSVRAAAEWLMGECAARGLDSPARSSVERFSDVLFEEYRIADQRRRRAMSAQFRKVAAEGTAEAGLTATVLLAEKLDDWLARIDEIDDLDVKEIVALSLALRQVTQTLNDKRNSDARITALEKLNEERAVATKLKDQKLVERDLKLKSELAKQRAAVEAAEKAAAAGSGVAAVVGKVREILGIEG